VQASDPVSSFALSIALLLAVAKLGGDLAARIGQLAVLGELLSGVAIGSIPLPFVAHLRDDAYVDMLSRVGALVLLFEVGLESTVSELFGVGPACAAVAVLGTTATMVAGWFATRLALPAEPTLVHLFLAAALTATSIGISARVIKDTGASRGKEARTILGAAVIDDVLGLVVLAVIGGVVAQGGHGTPDVRGVAWLLFKSVSFLALALLAGTRLSPTLFRLTARLRSDGVLVAAGLSFCFVLSWASDAVGLSPIVGAFTAGLILEEPHSARFTARGERPLADLIEPISSWLVPIFFVMMGIRADFAALAHPTTLLLVAVLGVAAVIGKLACAMGAPSGTDRLAVAAGMLPRGEVTLVFASLGRSLRFDGRPLLGPGAYSALVTTVVLTSLVTPPALRWRLRKSPA
jgi:Kef-type K+ transport system membrane component KefB